MPAIATPSNVRAGVVASQIIASVNNAITQFTTAYANGSPEQRRPAFDSATRQPILGADGKQATYLVAESCSAEEFRAAMGETGEGLALAVQLIGATPEQKKAIAAILAPAPSA